MKNSQRQIRPSTANASSGRFTNEEARYERPAESQNEPPSRGPAAYADVPPSLFKRLTAEIGDRLVALFVFAPIIAAPMLLIGKEHFAPMWLFVVVAWHLLRDASPGQRSLFKKVCRLRVVGSNGREKCGYLRLILRRSGSAVSQFFYALTLAMLFPSWEISQSAIGSAKYIFAIFGASIPRPNVLMMLALFYDIVSLILILITPSAQRLEELITRTRVIPEKALLGNRKQCEACHRLMSKDASKCPHCGTLNFVRPPVIRRGQND
ncbi:MAG: hypothetical protein AB7U82_35845 [Blastocatellales bacterium]